MSFHSTQFISVRLRVRTYCLENWFFSSDFVFFFGPFLVFVTNCRSTLSEWRRILHLIYDGCFFGELASMGCVFYNIRTQCARNVEVKDASRWRTHEREEEEFRGSAFRGLVFVAKIIGSLKSLDLFRKDLQWVEKLLFSSFSLSWVSWMEGSWPAIALDTTMPQLLGFYGKIYVRSIEHVVIYGLKNLRNCNF